MFSSLVLVLDALSVPPQGDGIPPASGIFAGTAYMCGGAINLGRALLSPPHTELDGQKSARCSSSKAWGYPVNLESGHLYQITVMLLGQISDSLDIK